MRNTTDFEEYKLQKEALFFSLAEGSKTGRWSV
jgi:hypothetical protein